MDRQPGYGIKYRGILLLILHRLLELTVYNTPISGGDYRVQRIIRYIARHYAEKLRVKKLAALAGLNTAYFGVLFKQVTGFTVNRYIAMIRIQNAKNLLQSGGCRVAEAAEACGYQDMFHFYKQFKAITGVAPPAISPETQGSCIYFYLKRQRQTWR
ncbi:MAG: AraC family transcriptional regulator [Treponema sp.]|jgi:YesN/AraC family two-component response regulator|nr:AraC family transcriptional regulator [Treponema sp.]